MDPGPNAEPGAGPAEDIDGLSDKATIALLKRRLMEADHNVQQWKEQAEEARTELVKSKSNAKVLQAELENTLKELAQARGETLNQGGLAGSSKQQAEVEEKPAAAADIDGVLKVDEVDVSMDHTLARLLDQELNMGDGGTSRHRSSTSAGIRNVGNASPEIQLEKAKAKNQALRKKLDEMQDTAYQYQKLHHQERSQHIKTYDQARLLETEFNSARKHIHAQDKELKSVRKELEEMNELKEELGSFLSPFLGRWNAHLGLLPVSEGTSPTADK